LTRIEPFAVSFQHAGQKVAARFHTDQTAVSPVSSAHSKLVYDALKQCGVRLMSALPETWLVHLI
jgi:hypothetical protein